MPKARPKYRPPDRIIPHVKTTIGTTAVHRLTLEGEPWLIAAEVCEATGHAPPGDGSFGPYLRHLLPDERQMLTLPGPIGTWRRGQRLWLVTPAGAFKVALRGLYGAVIDGKPAHARSLLDWLAGQEVPSPALPPNAGPQRRALYVSV